MVSVTVYSTGPECPQCRLTYTTLETGGIPFDIVDLTEDESSGAREYVTSELGYSRAPVVVVDGEPEHHWSGFRPDLITSLAAHLDGIETESAAAVSAEGGRHG